MGIVELATVAVGILTYIVAEISKGFNINPKIIPLQNLAIGLASGIGIIIANGVGVITITEHYLVIMFWCIVASMFAGGAYDVVKMINQNKKGGV